MALIQHLRIFGIDEFVSSLWKIYKKSLREGYNQKIYLTVIRSDYMLHQRNFDCDVAIKQVEVNTIASGFGYASTKASQLHKYFNFGLND